MNDPSVIPVFECRAHVIIAPWDRLGSWNIFPTAKATHIAVNDTQKPIPGSRRRMRPWPRSSCQNAWTITIGSPARSNQRIMSRLRAFVSRLIRLPKTYPNAKQPYTTAISAMILVAIINSRGWCLIARKTAESLRLDTGCNDTNSLGWWTVSPQWISC